MGRVERNCDEGEYPMPRENDAGVEPRRMQQPEETTTEQSARNTMDIPRPDLALAKRRRRLILATVGVVCLAGATLGGLKIGRALPVVPRSTVVIGKVERGDLNREVHGAGILTSESILWITAETSGRVVKSLLKPGAPVAPESVILILANPEVELASLDAGTRLRIAEAEFVELEARLEAQSMTLRAESAVLEAELTESTLQAEAAGRLAQEGLTSAIDREIADARRASVLARSKIERERLVVMKRVGAAQRLAKEAEVRQHRALAELRKNQVAGLTVRAKVAGVLQAVSVEPGQQVTPGVPLALVADPGRLMARLRVAATEAQDIVPGLVVSVDTGTALVEGTVSRVDPVVKDGTVRVDVALRGVLPRGARPDLRVDGAIQIEHLADVLHLGRPTRSQAHSTIALFRIEPSGGHAEQVRVRLGRTSVSAVEILDGLLVGNEVILSDMSRWESYRRIAIR